MKGTPVDHHTNHRAERRYQLAVDATITLLLATIVAVAAGMIFAHDWTVAHAAGLFGGIAAAFIASFGWLFAAAAQSVADLPARDIGDPEPADEGTPPPVAEPVAEPVVAVNGDRPAPAPRGATR